MGTEKQIFIEWLKKQDLPCDELNHELAKKNNLKFNNHAPNADDKEFITEEALESAFKVVMKASH